MNFYVGDKVYIKSLGQVGAISRVIVLQTLDGGLHLVGYEMGADLSSVLRPPHDLELLEGGAARKLAEEHEARDAAPG